MSNENETKDILKKMAQLTISSNQINEVQQKNLKMYALVFFNGVKTVKIDYDLTNTSTVDFDTDPVKMDIVYKFQKPKTDNFKITYYLEIDESQGNSSLDKRFDALEKAIATLFWTGIPIEVLFNGKSVYKSVQNAG